MPTFTPEDQAEDLQPIIDAAEAAIDPEHVDTAKAFFKRYLKGWIALAGVSAAYSLQFFPIDSIAAQVAGAVIGISTVIGLVAARNGI